MKLDLSLRFLTIENYGSVRGFHVGFSGLKRSDANLAWSFLDSGVVQTLDLDFSGLGLRYVVNGP